MQVTVKGLKPKYHKIYRLALPYYKKGRKLDNVHHLVVAANVSHILKEIELDEEVLIAAALLHDIGYSKISQEKRKTHWEKQVKRDHMKYGAEISKKILIKINFPKEKIQQVSNIILEHDNNELGLPIKSKEAKVLKEADILWMATERAFWLDVKRRPDLIPEDWLNILEKRFTKEKAYTKYLKTKYSKKRVKIFLKKMKKQLRS
jgi:putative nucleotidyltransferase with HDIG domain